MWPGRRGSPLIPGHSGFSEGLNLRLGWRRAVRSGTGGRAAGLFRASRGRRVGWELLDGDGDEVGGDVRDHHVLAAGCHFGVPVGVSFGRDPFGFGWGAALVPGGGYRRRTLRSELIRSFPAFLRGRGRVQDTLLLFSI